MSPHRATVEERLPLPLLFFWRDERGTLAYDLWVAAILAFVWLTPPDWLRDPTASGAGIWDWF